MQLAIDSSTETASVALTSQGELVAELTWHAGQNHTAGLIPNIERLLEQGDVSVKDIDALIVAMGPGSFNGLRVGMSVAKGLAFAFDIPVVGVSTLEVEAYPYAATGLPICAIMGAGRGDIAAALFQVRRGKWRRLVEEHITTVDGLLQGIAGRTVFCGRMPLEAASHIRRRLGSKALIVDGAGAVRRAGYLAELGLMRLEDGARDHCPTLQPLYLKRPAITVSRRWRFPAALGSG